MLQMHKRRPQWTAAAAYSNPYSDCTVVRRFSFLFLALYVGPYNTTRLDK